MTNDEIRKANRPEGALENSPAIYRWVFVPQNRLSPVGAKENLRQHKRICRPCRDSFGFWVRYPPINRWAIVESPSGTKGGTGRCNLIVVALLATQAMMFYGCSPASSEAAKDTAPPLSVQVIKPKHGPITRSVTLPGEVKA